MTRIGSRILEVFRKRDGVTLPEVLVAMVISTMLCAGLMTVGFKTRRFAEHIRLATEARSLAKERVEEMISVGRGELAKSSCMLTNACTNLSSQESRIVRKGRMDWHAADGVITQKSSAAYVEIHVDVGYLSPLFDRQVTDTYSVIVQ